MTEAGKQYGSALYMLCLEENLTEEISPMLLMLEQCFHNTPAFLSLLSSPALSKAERRKILDSSLQGVVHSYLLNFLKLLMERGYIRHFFHCCQSFRQLYEKDHNILTVCAVTAVAMSQEQQRYMTEKLTAITGKTIRLDNYVDPQVLGGVCMYYDGKKWDDTISGRLDQVHRLLRNMRL